MQDRGSLTVHWVLELLKTAQGSKEPCWAKSRFCVAGKKSKSTKRMGWGPKMRLFRLAFGIIALLGEQPFFNGGSWAHSPALKGVRRAWNWAEEEKEPTNRPGQLNPSQRALLRTQ